MLALSYHARDKGDFAAGGDHFDGGTGAGGVRGAGLGGGGGEEVRGGGVEGGVADCEGYAGMGEVRECWTLCGPKGMGRGGSEGLPV